MRNSVMLSSYIIFPMMAGLAGIAEPLIKLLLTDKWLPCVPYMQIYCFTFAFYPIHTCNLQAINAVGRSDVFLKLEVIKKALGITALTVAVVFFDSPIAIAMTGIVTGLISFFVNASPNKKLINYSYLEQVRDILPSFLASLAMCGCVLAVNLLHFNEVIVIILQVVVGVFLYVGISSIFKLEPYMLLFDALKNKAKKQ